MEGIARRLYRFGDFQIDVSRRELRRADLLIPLQPQLYDTLLALVERAGTTIEPGALVLRVWPDRFVDGDVLSRTLSALRKALGDMPDGRPYIEMHPRYGCRLVADVEECISPPSAPIDLQAHSRAAMEDDGSSLLERAWWMTKAIVAGACAVGVGYWLTALAVELP